uniref:Uncharacterized protein n=1 Tax=Anopheles minimus TaxID=112268 RepID=A0A182WNG0_9DIPT
QVHLPFNITLFSGDGLRFQSPVTDAGIVEPWCSSTVRLPSVRAAAYYPNLPCAVQCSAIVLAVKKQCSGGGKLVMSKMDYTQQCLVLGALKGNAKLCRNTRKTHSQKP